VEGVEVEAVDGDEGVVTDINVQRLVLGREGQPSQKI